MVGKVQMTVATLSRGAAARRLRGGYAVPGLVCLGWEDMRAYVARRRGGGCAGHPAGGAGGRAHTPLPVWGAMFRHLAESASRAGRGAPGPWPFCTTSAAGRIGRRLHLGDVSTGRKAALRREHRLRRPRSLSAGRMRRGRPARASWASSAILAGHASFGTDPEEAARFARETGVDAMAVSVGNVHLQRTGRGRGWTLRGLAAIEAVTEVPLVIHGGARACRSRATRRCSRQGVAASASSTSGRNCAATFGMALRQALDRHPERFDRIAILKETHEPMMAAARQIIQDLLPCRADPAIERAGRSHMQENEFQSRRSEWRSGLGRIGAGVMGAHPFPRFRSGTFIPQSFRGVFVCAATYCFPTIISRPISVSMKRLSY